MGATKDTREAVEAEFAFDPLVDDAGMRRTHSRSFSRLAVALAQH